MERWGGKGMEREEERWVWYVILLDFFVDGEWFDFNFLFG